MVACIISRSERGQALVGSSRPFPIPISHSPDWMGDVSAVIGVGVVVVGHGGIAARLELPAKAKGHGVVAAFGKSGVAVDPGGNDAAHGREFATGGRLGPVGLVVVVKDKSVVRELVERGRALFVDGGVREALGGDEDKVFVFEISGVLILLRGHL